MKKKKIDKKMERRMKREAKKVDKARKPNQDRSLDRPSVVDQKKEEKKLAKISKEKSKNAEKMAKIKAKDEERNIKIETLKSKAERQERRIKAGKKIVNPKKKKFLVFMVVVSLLAVSTLLVYFRLIAYFVFLLALIIIFIVYLLIRKRLKRYNDIKKMEAAFPDFISLMAANLRAGMTVDRALLLSSRKEFAPLDKEISQLGKDIVTGREIDKAMLDMADRIQSEEIKKTVLLIVSGIKSGGNLSVLLEQVSSNMRETSFIRKKAASNVLMYVIFIFFAVAFGAPILFGLSSILLGVLTNIVADLPSDQVTSASIPFLLTEISITEGFVFYFSIAFLLVSSVLSSFVLGLVSKGAERDGIKYIVPLMMLSVGTFLLSRFVMMRFFPSFLG